MFALLVCKEMKTNMQMFWKIAYRLGLVVIAIQTLLGLGWILENILVLPDFAETKVLLNMSQTGVIDEYGGPLYVAVISTFRWLENLVGIPFQIPIYLLQLMLAAYSVFAFARECGANWEKAKWMPYMVSAYVNSIPFLLQAHFAVLPYSASGSIFLLLLTELMTLCRGAKTRAVEQKDFLKKAVRVVLLWALSSLILPEYHWLSGLLVLFGLIYIGLCLPKLRGWCVLTVALGVLWSGFLLVAFTQEGSRGRMQNTLEAQAARRLAWPDILRMYSFWEPEIIESFTIDEMAQISMVPERMEDLFGPRIEQIYGKEKANEIYKDMAVTALLVNTKEVLGQVLCDFGSYLCPPVAITLEGKGVGGTYTGHHYEKLQSQNVGLTNLYVEWSQTSFGVLMLLMLLNLPWYVKNHKTFLSWGGVALLMQVLYYTWTTGGMVSYLKNPVAFVFWGTLAVLWLLRERKEE